MKLDLTNESVAAVSARPSMAPATADAASRPSVEAPARPKDRVQISEAAGPAAPQQLEDAKKAQEARLQELVDESNAQIEDPQHRVSIELHEGSGRYVVRVLGEGDEVLRQFPSEDFLAVSEQLSELRGMLFEGQG